MSTFLVCPQFVTAFQHGAHAPRELASAISRGARVGFPLYALLDPSDLSFRGSASGTRAAGALSPHSRLSPGIILATRVSGSTLYILDIYMYK